MKEEEAAAYLGIIKFEGYSAEDIREEYEERVFEINHFFLRRTIVPSLILSRLAKLIKLEEAACSLLKIEINPVIYEELRPFSPSKMLQEPQNLIELIRNFDFKRSQILLRLSNSLDVIQSLRSLKNLYCLQISFGILIKKFLENSLGFLDNLKLFEEDVKLAENVSTGELINLAKEEDFSSPKFSREYIRQQRIIEGINPSLLCQ